MARAISVRPLPTRPASPTISPARTSKEMSWKAGGRLSPRTASTTGASAGGGTGVGKATSSERPSIAVTRLSEVSSAAGVVFTWRPSLSTVTVSHRASTSPRMCET